MTGETTPKVRTTIIKVPDATPGLVFVNGQQKPFTLEGVWKSPVAPVVNMTVDVVLDSVGVITSIIVVDAQQLNKERLEQLSGVAQERGKEAAKLAQQGVGALAARMGAVALGATVLVWIAWFFLPAASVSGGFAGSMSFTFWNLLGVDFDNPETLMGGGSSHGAFALLGLLAIVAPFVAPFISMAWSKYLNAAPIAFVVLAFIVLHVQINKAFGDLASMGAPNPFSWSWGFYLLVLAAVVLGAHTLRPHAKA